MKLPKLLVYLMIVSLLILGGIWFVESGNQQFAYDIGGVYLGTLVGIMFALFVRPFEDILGKSIREAISIFSHRQRKLIRGSKTEYIAVIGMGILLAVMTIIDDYTFLGNNISENHSASVVIIGGVGFFYGLTLLAHEMWFDYLIWQGKLIYYIIALLVTLFLLSIVFAISNQFLATPFFVVGIISRSITSIVMYARNYHPETTYKKVEL